MTDPKMPIRRYTRPAIILHWLIAALMILNVALIWSVDWLPDQRIRLVIDSHKSFGITVLGLALLRILWRIGHPPPPLPQSYGMAEKAAAHGVHLLLYGLMLGLPLSGWMHDSAWKAAGEVPMYWFGLFEWPRIGWIMAIEPGLKERLHDLFGAVHGWFGYGLYALVGLHVAAALKHQWWDGDAELQRMLPQGGAVSAPSPAPRPPA